VSLFLNRTRADEIFWGSIVRKSFLLSWLFISLAASAAEASSLTYTPVNPTFGGNPNNGSYLLSTAQAQGKGVSSSGSSVDLSGLESALSSLGASAGSVVIVGGSTSSTSSTTTTPTNP